MRPIVVLSAFTTAGHVNPVFAIAAKLAPHVETVVITHGAYSQVIEDKRVKRIVVDSDSEFRALNDHIEMLNRPATVPEFFRRFLIPLADRECAAICDVLAKSDGVIVSPDAPGLGSRLAAERLQKPFVSLVTAPGFASSRPLYASMLGTRLSKEISALRMKYQLLPAFDAAKWLNMASHHIALWPRWYEKQSLTELGSVSHAGFVDLERKRNSVEIVDDTYDVVITGGSARTASARFFEVALSACARLQLKSCVISRFEDLLPKTLWGSMTHRTWVEDLSSVLSGSRVAIHHGGMGSVAAACAAGVPQIVMASGGDRPENGRRIHSLKLGSLVPVGSWNVDSVSRRIQHVLDDERFQRRAAAARRLVSRSRAADHASRTLLNVLCV